MERTAGGRGFGWGGGVRGVRGGRAWRGRGAGVGWLLLGAALACGCGVAPGSDAERLARVTTLAVTHDADVPSVPRIAAADGVGLEPGGVVWVDVRSAAERAVSGLNGAVTTEAFAAAWAADPEACAGRRVVAYCTIGRRSGRWAAQQRERGVNAANLSGGVLAWAHAGGGFVDPAGRATRRVHVYGRAWDLLPAGYVGVR